MAWEELHEDLVFVGLEATTPEEIFEKMGGRLRDLGYVKDTYPHALAEREAVFPTGLDLGDGRGVAIPHTDPEHVNRSAVAIATLKEPVRFVQMGSSPEEHLSADARLIIMLAMQGSGHLEMLQQAVLLIQVPGLYDKLIGASDAQEIIGIIKGEEEG